MFPSFNVKPRPQIGFFCVLFIEQAVSFLESLIVGL